MLKTSICTAALLALPALAQAQGTPADFFETRIRPILAASCVSCHNAKLKTGNLDFTSGAAFQSLGESGPSRLLSAIAYSGKIKMPPTGKLTDQEIADVAAWVKAGAIWPSTTLAPAADPRAWWAFQPVKDHAPPAGKNTAAIDRFILARLEASGLTPARPASRLTLLRRATFDLTGLPPTPKEIGDFLADLSPDAFAKVIDRLLASPRYGERWGRHWLDVARYADSTGADEDIRYPYAYRYRDYVIDAFNSDMPYNQFVTEQLAGDLLPAPNPGEVNRRGIIATGFLQVGLKLLAEQDKPKMVYDMVDEQLDTTSRAFMGLTVACARCHDHKFDPIPTRDYYSLAGIFASTKSLAKVEGTVSELYFAPLAPADVYSQYDAHRKRIRNKQREIDQLVTSGSNRYTASLGPRLAAYMLAAYDYEHRPEGMDGVCVEDFARPLQLQPKVLERWIEYLTPNDDVQPHLDRWRAAAKQGRAAAAGAAAVYQKEFDQASLAWEKKVADWSAKLAFAVARTGDVPADVPDKPDMEAGKNRFFATVSSGSRAPFALAAAERKAQFPAEANEKLARLEAGLAALRKSAPPQPDMACGVTEGPEVRQRVFLRGSPASPGEEAPKQFLTIIAGDRQTPVAKGSGRLELARWLTDPSHPLTARVKVNRIWQWHFGEGLVRTPGNYGRLGETPSHPELLDYLAKRFVESGWSIKKMHRLIMLSSAYQMSSEITREQAEKDPANRLLSRMDRRRLDVEEV
ncbi:MAG: DUF1549 domain-containing protein, partial [Bryobacteraceae bacterium]